MKMSSRHRLLTLVSVRAVPVFFIVLLCLTSCGVPTYWQPKNSTAISSSTSSSSNNVVNFNVTVNYYSGDDGSNAPNLGLVLLYVYANEPNTTISSELVKQFNTSYRGTSPNGVSTLQSEANEAIWSFTVSDIDYNVYAFNGAISAPNYNKDLTATSDFTKAIKLVLNDSVDSVDFYIDETLDSTLVFVLNDLTSLKDSNYIHVYAALSAQGENYGNIYWSNLTYVGSFTEFNSSSSGSSSGTTGD